VDFGERGHGFKSRDAHKLSWVWTASTKNVSLFLSSKMILVWTVTKKTCVRKLKEKVE
jgi:hypothetical protein